MAQTGSVASGLLVRQAEPVRAGEGAVRPIEGAMDLPGPARAGRRGGIVRSGIVTKTEAGDPFAALVACVRAAVDNDPGQLREARLETVDWARVIKAAHHHGVTPTLYSIVSRTLGDLPPAARSTLQHRFAQNTRRNLFFASELHGLLSALSAAGIDAMAFRGPVLAVQAYGNLSYREFEDLDVLVHPRDVVRARAVLESRGFVWEHRLSRMQERGYRRFGHDYQFLRADHRLRVEVHWALLPRRFMSMDTGPVWQRSTVVRVAGRELRTLSPEDLLIVLCAHGTKHYWERLGWILDAVLLVRNTPALDWDYVARRAEALGARRMILLTFELARRILGVNVPVPIAARDRDRTAAARLAARTVELMGEGSNLPDALEGFAYHLRAIEGLGRRIRYCVSPTQAEPELLPLPAILSPIYYVLRPIRLAGQHGAALAGRGTARRAR